MALFTVGELKQRGRSASGSYKTASMVLKESFSEFSSTINYDIFLSHSFKDAETILGLKVSIEEIGHSVYVDWIEDAQLDRSRVNKETARLLRERMKNCKSLFFAVSSNSGGSVWMPWELGYFDGLQGKVAIVPIAESTIFTDSYQGQEYLGLYPYVTKGRSTLDKLLLWIHESADKYIGFSSWLSGRLPTQH